MPRAKAAFIPLDLATRALYGDELVDRRYAVLGTDGYTAGHDVSQPAKLNSLLAQQKVDYDELLADIRRENFADYDTLDETHPGGVYFEGVDNREHFRELSRKAIIPSLPENEEISASKMMLRKLKRSYLIDTCKPRKGDDPALHHHGASPDVRGKASVFMPRTLIDHYQPKSLICDADERKPTARRQQTTARRLNQAQSSRKSAIRSVKSVKSRVSRSSQLTIMADEDEDRRVDLPISDSDSDDLQELDNMKKCVFAERDSIKRQTNRQMLQRENLLPWAQKLQCNDALL